VAQRELSKKTENTKMATSAGRPRLCSLLRPACMCHAAAHLLPGAVCFICAILSADFVDWALASCTRANQRETGQRRHGKGEATEGIGSCQHGLVCHEPTKLPTRINVKTNEWQFGSDRCVLGLVGLQTPSGSHRWLLET